MDKDQKINRAVALSRKGYTNVEIALSLGLSERAVRVILAENTGSIVRKPTEGVIMEDAVDVVKDAVTELSTPHQFGKMLAGAVAGFVATKLGEKAYVAALTAYRAKNGSTTV